MIPFGIKMNNFGFILLWNDLFGSKCHIPMIKSPVCGGGWRILCEIHFCKKNCVWVSVTLSLFWNYLHKLNHHLPTHPILIFFDWLDICQTLIWYFQTFNLHMSKCPNLSISKGESDPTLSIQTILCPYHLDLLVRLTLNFFIWITYLNYIEWTRSLDWLNLMYFNWFSELNCFTSISLKVLHLAYLTWTTWSLNFEVIQVHLEIQVILDGLNSK